MVGERTGWRDGLELRKKFDSLKQGNRRELARLLTQIESGERLPSDEFDNHGY